MSLTFASMTVIDDDEALTRASAGFEQACQFANPNSLEGPTPCANWSVLELIDHVTGGNRFTVAVLAGTSSDQALAEVRASFGSDHQPVAAAVESLADQLDAFRVPGVSDATADHVAGPLTGREILRLRIHDMSIHTWDLNQAVHPEVGLDASLVRWAIAELADPASLAARHMAIFGGGPPRTAYELLASFGRRRGRPFG